MEGFYGTYDKGYALFTVPLSQMQRFFAKNVKVQRAKLHMEKPEMSNDLLNKEAQELMEIFNIQLEELASEGNNKVVAALITLGHIMGKDVQILREENKLLLKACHE